MNYYSMIEVLLDVAKEAANFTGFYPEWVVSNIEDLIDRGCVEGALLTLKRETERIQQQYKMLPEPTARFNIFAHALEEMQLAMQEKTGSQEWRKCVLIVGDCVARLEPFLAGKWGLAVYNGARNLPNIGQREIA